MTKILYLFPSLVLLLFYSIYCVHAAGEPQAQRSQSLIPFPRVGRSRSMLGSSSGSSSFSNNFPSAGTMRSSLLNELREFKRHLIPFPRVGKRQTLIPFPRVGRAFVPREEADDEEDYPSQGAPGVDDRLFYYNNPSRWTVTSQESTED